MAAIPSRAPAPKESLDNRGRPCRDNPGPAHHHAARLSRDNPAADSGQRHFSFRPPDFTLTGTQLVDATLNLTFKAVQRQGFLGSYTLSLTKCNAPNFPVEDLATAHPVQVAHLPGSPPCGGLYGTLFGVDPAASVNDEVSVQLNPPGSTPWLDPAETLSSFTLNLSASVRRTDGHSSNYPGYYGPLQYNLVIQRGA